MVWLVAGVCILGFALGTRYRLPVVAIASVVTATLGGAYGWTQELGTGGTLGLVVGLLAALQISYLAGVVLSSPPPPTGNG